MNSDGGILQEFSFGGYNPGCLWYGYPPVGSGAEVPIVTFLVTKSLRR